MNITITLSEEDQSLQAEILRVLLKGEEKEKETQSTPKPTEQPTPKPYPMAGGEEKEEAPSDTTSISDESDKSDETPKPTTQPTPKPYPPAGQEETPSDTSDTSDKTALSMADLRKSVNAISRKKGLNWLYSWLGDLGVKSITEIPTDRLEEAHTKLQNYA